MFRRLGAVLGRFSIEAAEGVVAGREGALAGRDVALGATAGLIDKSLLRRAETSVATRPMYEMLETVRAYAALELTAAERDEAMEGLSRYCTNEASLTAEGLVGPAQVEWLDRVRDDLENYRGALTWLSEHDRPAEASNIAWALKYFWLIREHAAEGLWYEQILTRVTSARCRVESAVGAAVMCRQGGSTAHAPRSAAPQPSRAPPATWIWSG